METSEPGWQRAAQAVLAAFEAEGVTASPPSSFEEWQWLAQSVADRLCGPDPQLGT